MDPKVAEKKAKASRKSSAYHVAKKQALRDGLSQEEAVKKAKEVSFSDVHSPSPVVWLGLT